MCCLLRQSLKFKIVQIEAIAQGATVCNFLLAPTLKSVDPGNRATISVELCPSAVLKVQQINFMQHILDLIRCI